MRLATGLACLLLLAAASPSPTGAGTIHFREVSGPWGLTFRHHNAATGQRYMVETMVGGVVIFDYDGDGDEDVFFVDGGVLPGYQGEAPRSRLFRNDGRGDDGPRFVDVTDRSGIAVAGYGAGAVSADVDGDGDEDLFVTEFGDDQLFINRGDGTFEDGTAGAGVGDPLWGASATFADFDRDGDLDLFVANYVDFSLTNHKFCGKKEEGIRAYCHPGVYNGLPDHLFRNRGDGTFEDATRASGLSEARGAGLGVVAGDLDDDGWPDLYVANDEDPNYLFHNKGDGTFEDVSLLSGAVYSDRGRPEAGMGVDLGDYDGDGDLDIIVTNFELETNALYTNTGSLLFVDSRFASGFAEPSLLKLAFGVAFADLDQDGDLDVVVANGHILDNAELFNPQSRYKQANQAFENLGPEGGETRFRLVAGSGLDVVRASRGLAVGDLDGDGDLDVVINNSNDLSEVYENTAGSGEGGSLLVDLEEPGGNRIGIGARLEVEAGGQRQIREVKTASSYLSQNALTTHFGLGAARRVERLRITWPDGTVQEIRDLPVDRRMRVVRLP